MDTAPFHPGERALHSRAGMAERLEAVGDLVVRDHMPEQHRELFGKLPTLLLGVLDGEGQPWATMLHGPAGFVSSPDPRTLRVRAWPSAGDPAASWLVEGAALGILGLEPHTRRRNRANGRIKSAYREGFDVDVHQSFGNCPKYIHARSLEPSVGSEGSTSQTQGAVALGPFLDSDSLDLLARADTLFIASASSGHPGAARAEGVDVSHRGGRRGFVAVGRGAQGVQLTMPDYVGNFFFNTLGNLLTWPRAGLLVPDYADGTMLHIAARASIEFEGPALDAFPGAQRLLHLDVLGGTRRPRALPLRWSAPSAPPQFSS